MQVFFCKTGDSDNLGVSSLLAGHDVPEQGLDTVVHPVAILSRSKWNKLFFITVVGKSKVEPSS